MSNKENRDKCRELKFFFSLNDQLFNHGFHLLYPAFIFSALAFCMYDFQYIDMNIYEHLLIL